MPEMPEIQAHAERMTEALAGAELASIRLLAFASLKTYAPSPDAAVGARLDHVARRGKYLLLHFEGGDLGGTTHTHIVHLMQGGRLRPDPKVAAKPRGGLMRWTFDDLADAATRSWLLTEAGTERRAGLWVVEGDPFVQPPLDRLGPEASEIDRSQLAQMLTAQARRIHGLLRDQQVVAGLGRMLTNEILYQARLSPFANASTLSSEDLDRLHSAIGSVLGAATEYERTLDDIGKSIDRPSKVHHRAGEQCVECDDTVRSIEYRAYTVYYCPSHQTGGRILADNTTSKFLR